MNLQARFCAAAFAAALLAACASRPMPLPFPIGIYDAPRAALPQLRQAGFNLVTIGPGETNRSAYLDAARTNRIQVILTPSLATPSQRAATARHDRHPALWAWYLSDEPDLNLVPPPDLREQRRQLRSVARKPAYLTVASGAALEKYAASADRLAVDWYPVPWAPLATLSREMRSARLAAHGRPFLALLQAFDWGAYPDLIRGSAPMRGPTAGELRCMAYLSLFQGADGILFYSYGADAWQLRAHPAMWQAVTNLSLELQANAPIFKERVPWWPVVSRYPDHAETYNEIHEGSIALNLFRVRKPQGAVEAGYYFAAVNTSARPVTFAFRMPFGAGDWLERRYQPFEVVLTGPIRSPLLSRLP